MKIPVEAIGGSVILGHWNEQTEKFILNKRLPRKLKKSVRKKGEWYKFHKDTLKTVIDFNLKKGWDSSFSIRIGKEKMCGIYHTYFSPYIKSEGDITGKDLIYRIENEDKIKINFKK